jgi:hypothetical protein
MIKNLFDHACNFRIPPRLFAGRHQGSIAAIGKAKGL